MPESNFPVNGTLEELEEFILERLPRLLERDPRFVTFIEGIVAEKFPRRDEFARMLNELQEHRAETKLEFARVDQRFEQVDQRFEQVDQRFEQVDQRFEQVDQRFEQVDQRFGEVIERLDRGDERAQAFEQRMDRMEARMEEGFYNLHVAIDRLGGRWGIRNEIIFRKTMRKLFEDSFGVTVDELYIKGEQYDCVIRNGKHILIEIAASVGPKIQQRLERKRQIYIDETGVVPDRFVLAVGSISSRRAEELRTAGFEVIEPDEDYD